MLITERDRLREDVLAIAELTDCHRASLIPILRKVKEKYRGIDTYAMQLIADVLGIHPVEVYSVATFYSFIQPQTQGRLAFRLCRTLSCELEGKESVAEQLQRDLGIGFGETTPDQVFSLEWANCMGMCDQGPAMLVNETVYTQLTPGKVHDIVEEYKSQQEGHVTKRQAERVL
ncbi:MAG: NAD(P)H-dependent oxidoreductase subunit E [Actinobacteria bacterium]|nr:NAD(P)H-dependent oxidoreductase subunit E [Actinomycetota bacterium]